MPFRELLHEAAEAMEFGEEWLRCARSLGTGGDRNEPDSPERHMTELKMMIEELTTLQLLHDGNRRQTVRLPDMGSNPTWQSRIPAEDDTLPSCDFNGMMDKLKMLIPISEFRKLEDPESDEEDMSWVEELKQESEDEGRAQANTPAKGVVERFEGSMQGRSEPEVPQEEVEGGLADAVRPKEIGKGAQENQLTIAEVAKSANQDLSDTHETQKEKGEENSLEKSRVIARHSGELEAKIEESSEGESTFIVEFEDTERDPARPISCPLIDSKYEENLRREADEAEVTETSEADKIGTAETGEVFRKNPIDQPDEPNQARPENWSKTGNRPNLVGSYRSSLWRIIAALPLIFVIGMVLKATPFPPESGSLIKYRLSNEMVPRFGLSTWSKVYRDEDGRTRPKAMITDLFRQEINDVRGGPAKPRAVRSHELNDEFAPRFGYLTIGRGEDSRTRPRLMVFNVLSRKMTDFRDNERARPRTTHSFKICWNASRLRGSNWMATYHDDDGRTRPKFTAGSMTYGRIIDFQNDDRTRPKHAAVGASYCKMIYFDDDGRTRPKLASISTRNRRTANFRDYVSRTRSRVAIVSLPYDKRRNKPPRLKRRTKRLAPGVRRLNTFRPKLTRWS